MAVKPVAFGNYTLLRRLAQGGMADLFLACDSRSAQPDQPLVVKTVAARFAQDTALLTMFREEVWLASLLDHPNIGRVYEVGEIGGCHFLAMEYLHGYDTRAICRRSVEDHQRPLPVELAVQIGARVCDALEYAHNARGPDGGALSLIHRDLSPSNIMVTFEGRVALVDFGIAKAANRASFTEPGQVKGKIRYLSPEQVLGAQASHCSDIFTLGTVLWESTVGQHLFEGKHEIEICAAIREGRSRSPSSVIAGYPAGMERILQRALARDPRQRYATAQQMKADLEAFAAEAGIRLSPGSLAGYLQGLFPADYDAWDRARAEGKSLLEHLCDVLPNEGFNDLRLLLSYEDERKTIPADPDSRPAGKRSTLPMGGSNPRISLGPVVKPRARTDGQLTHGSSRAVADEPRPAASSAANVLRAADAGREVGLSTTATKPSTAPPAAVGGHVVGAGPGATIEPAHSARMTAYDPRLPQAAAPAPQPTGVDPKLATSPTLHVQEPSAADLAAGRERYGAKLTAKLGTGDWAHQKAAAGDRRPGTHPYFDPKAQRSHGGDPIDDEEQLRLPRRRVGLIAAVVAVGVVVAGVTGLLLATRADAPPSSAAPAKVASFARPAAPARPTPPPAKTTDPTPPAAQTKRQIASVPAGAAVFVAATGEELGQTPLELDAEALGKKLELHLDGYRVHALTLDDSREQWRVELSRLPAPTAARRPSARPPPKPAKPSADLIDPFE